jgi:hypothetical protein
VTQPERPRSGRPLYWRLLRLKHVQPSSWQRAAFFEGSLVVAGVLVLADLASAWLLIVLPVAVALIVKAHDVYAGWLAPAAAAPTEPAADPVSESGPDETPPEEESNVRVVSDPEATPSSPPSSPAQPSPRAARSRPGAAAARARASAAQGVRRRRVETQRGRTGSD